MSKVLEKIKQAKKKKGADNSDESKQAVADRYIADIKEKARIEAFDEFKEQYITPAHTAELKGAQKLTKAAQAERDALKELLETERSQVAQLTDLVKSLKAEINNISIDHESSEEKYEETIEAMAEQIKTLELALIEVNNRPIPAPVIQESPKVLPSAFKFTPTRDPNGRTIDVVAEPIYEFTN